MLVAFAFSSQVNAQSKKTLSKYGIKAVVETVSEDGQTVNDSKKVFNKDGETRWWLVSGAPNINDKGECIGSIGIHLDITQQKVLEKNLKKH